MASLHRDKRGKGVWYVAFRKPNGQRTFKSTETTIRKEAEVVLRRSERALEKASAGNLTANAAREIITEIYELATGDKLRSYTAEGWLQEWLQEKKASTSGGSFKKYETVIAGLVASLGDRARLNIGQIIPQDVRRFRDARVSDGISPNTANDDLGIVRMAFTKARKQGLIIHNPAEAVESLDETLPDDVEAVKHPFTVEQIQAILRVAEGDWKGACMVGFYSGARLRDVANLRYKNVDLQNRWIEFRQIKTRKKTGGKVKLPMSESLHNYLLELTASDNGEDFIFPTLANRESGGARGLSTEFAKIMEQAHVRGQIIRRRQGGKSRSVNSLTFHSFRHTLTSILANAGVPAEVRSKFTGHPEKFTPCRCAPNRFFHAKSYCAWADKRAASKRTTPNCSNRFIPMLAESRFLISRITSGGSFGLEVLCNLGDYIIHRDEQVTSRALIPLEWDRLTWRSRILSR